ncbi:MAG: rhomboid family intramembrane serine protease [Candidatus Bathyarchaeota archaeon]|nr:MAG: rhomboid family intramembrane serine protease [Candidatus Bathyarchaeota archaeon]
MASKVPVVTYLLILANVLMFYYMMGLPELARFDFVHKYGLVPANVMQGEQLPTLITSMFLHGNFLHLVLNMLFLLISGGECERAMGNSRFLAFYMISGIGSGLFHAYLNSTSTIPTIGASGAIFGVLAAFAILFPFKLVISFIGFIPIPLPAIVFVLLSVWLETVYVFTGANPNVAHEAHIGGFLAGFFLTLLFGPSKREED